MERRLFIDGKDLGPVIGYRQNRESEMWVFLMESGYYISVEWSGIKRFDSGSSNLEIDLYH